MDRTERPLRQRHQKALHRSLTRPPIFSEDAVTSVLQAAGLREVESETRLKFWRDLECQAWEFIIAFERGDAVVHVKETGRPREVALNDFLGVMEGCWMAHFDQRLKTSVSRKTGQPSGPLVEFLLACCEEFRTAVEQERPPLPSELRRRVALGLIVGRSGIRHRVERSAWLMPPSGDRGISDT